MDAKVYILVVDDDAVYARQMKEAFEHYPNVHCDTAHGIREALARFNQFCDKGQLCYDAMVSDVDLPTVSGLGLLKAVRTVHLTLPVFLLTGYDISIIRVRAKEFHATVDEKPLLDPDAYFHKVMKAAKDYQPIKPPNDHPRLVLPEIAEEIIRRASAA